MTVDTQSTASLRPEPYTFWPCDKNHVYNKPTRLLASEPCLLCGSQVAEKIYKWLIDNYRVSNILCQAVFEWSINERPYDFAILNLGVIIEIDHPHYFNETSPGANLTDKMRIITDKGYKIIKVSAQHITNIDDDKDELTSFLPSESFDGYLTRLSQCSYISSQLEGVVTPINNSSWYTCSKNPDHQYYSSLSGRCMLCNNGRGNQSYLAMYRYLRGRYDSSNIGCNIYFDWCNQSFSPFRYWHFVLIKEKILIVLDGGQAEKHIGRQNDQTEKRLGLLKKAYDMGYRTILFNASTYEDTRRFNYNPERMMRSLDGNMQLGIMYPYMSIDTSSQLPCITDHYKRSLDETIDSGRWYSSIILNNYMETDNYINGYINQTLNQKK